MIALPAAFAAIDAANAADPNHIDVDGVATPAALVYGRRMSATLQTFAPGAGAALQIAARGQHIERWTIPRASYPEGRIGYLTWRKELQRLHARRLSEILAAPGCEAALGERVGQLVRKERLAADGEAQTLEDVACLVFLAHDLLPFAAGREDAQVSSILAKTWKKMSSKAHSSSHGRATAGPDHRLADGRPRSDETIVKEMCARPAVVLVAHGERGGRGGNALLTAHAERVARDLGGGLTFAGVLSGTPAFEDALGAAQATGAREILIYPFFMSDGYFVRTVVPQRIEKCGLTRASRLLDPRLGLDPGLPALIHARGRAECAAAGWLAGSSRLLIVGHGSSKLDASARATRMAAAAVAKLGEFAAVETAFLEEPPWLADALTDPRPSVITGFLSGEGLHGHEDIP